MFESELQSSGETNEKKSTQEGPVLVERVSVPLRRSLSVRGTGPTSGGETGDGNGVRGQGGEGGGRARHDDGYGRDLPLGTG